MTVKEKALVRVRELLNYNDVDFDNIGISCGDRFEINKVINLDTNDKIILYSVKEISSSPNIRQLFSRVSIIAL